MHSGLTAETVMAMISKQVQRGLEAVSIMYTREAAMLQTYDAALGNACAVAAEVETLCTSSDLL